MIAVDSCTGCGVCALICPMECISMNVDEEGFRYPSVDEKRCIVCGKCRSVCHRYSGSGSLPPISAYAAQSTDAADLINSSSGGIFSLLARQVLECGGLVVGCAFTEKLEPKHVAISEVSELCRLQGSKYVESTIDGVLPVVREQARQGRTILFTGTGCQIAAARKYLEAENTENVYFVEILCHGVPSRKFFKEHTEYVSGIYNDVLTGVSFRSKHRTSWGLNYVLQYSFKSGREERIPFYKDVYYSAFINGASFRRECYNCRYAGTKRIGDMTIGDCWGFAERDKNIVGSKGVSLIIVVSEKGMKLLDGIGDRLNLCPVEIAQFAPFNHALNAPAAMPERRATIYDDLARYGYEKMQKRYKQSGEYFRQLAKYRIKKLMPYTIRSYISIQLKRIIKKRNNDAK